MPMEKAELESAIAHARELFEALEPISARKMFGGAGLYYNGAIFALIINGELMVKADPKNPAATALIADLEAAGSTLWRYVRSSGRAGHMPYYRLPESALEDPEEACDWARRAIAALGA